NGKQMQASCHRASIDAHAFRETHCSIQSSGNGIPPGRGTRPILADEQCLPAAHAIPRHPPCDHRCGSLCPWSSSVAVVALDRVCAAVVGPAVSLEVVSQATMP